MCENAKCTFPLSLSTCLWLSRTFFTPAHHTHSQVRASTFHPDPSTCLFVRSTRDQKSKAIYPGWCTRVKEWLRASREGWGCAACTIRFKVGYAR